MKMKEKGLRIMGKLSDYVQNNPEILSKLLKMYEENRTLSLEMRKLEIENDVQIEKIIKRYESFRYLLTLIFEERSKALFVHYQVLDKALFSNDRELIINSLRGISTIVTQNPLESFVEFSRILDDRDEILKLDF